jgi:hypothetical protein
MAVEHGKTRVGVCVVTARTDASAGVLITVTARRDVDDAPSESVLHTARTEAALARVAEFLASVDGPDGAR